MSFQKSNTPRAQLATLDIFPSKINWNLTPEELIEASISSRQGVLAANGALTIKTGKFTGRSPKDRYIVLDEVTAKTVDWGEINKPISAENADKLAEKLSDYLSDRPVYVKDAKACTLDKYSIKVRVVSEYPWSSQFAHNMFIQLKDQDMENFVADWTVICAPGFQADPSEVGTRQENFAIIQFSKKRILIGGTGYTGEIKKGIFSVLNTVLPMEQNVLPMHCSANVGKEGDVAIFFGLSGTGKTTLSADPERALIGDDEHGWSQEGVFNFEGGCYAKTIDLTEEKEPQIFKAVKHGAILENTNFLSGTRNPDYLDSSITQNIRVSYPIEHIPGVWQKDVAGAPKDIFFLTCDAFGVLPPISRLSKEQAMYYFLAGYTAKVAGTEEGVEEPQATFSACFGAPFLPLPHTTYAKMLGEKIDQNDTRVWLVNTGWVGGSYGTGKRISLKYTRSMITAAMNGELDAVDYETHPIFGLEMPAACPNVPVEVLSPVKTWADADAYTHKAQDLANQIEENFQPYAEAMAQVKRVPVKV